ncbi:MAG: hypothetical protein EKK55_24315 [Rhodocyclaceae bacterium]|nr:MAG: hypothetical protein EKK55_24315 [Rhodocyclaceae bacterium]
MTVTLKLPRRSAAWRREDSMRVGDGIRRAILTRTRAGRDVEGDRFRPLKADGSPSTLTDTGRMLRSLRVRATDTAIVIEAGVDYAEHVEAAGRRFLGLTRDEVEAVGEAIEETIDRRLRGDEA